MHWNKLTSFIVQAGFAVMCTYWLQQKWGMLWLAMKLQKTTEELEEWNRQWFMVQSTHETNRPTNHDTTMNVNNDNNKHSDYEEEGNPNDTTKSRRLMEYALKATPKVIIVHW